MIFLFISLFLAIAWIDWHKRVIWHAITVPSIGIALMGSQQLPAGNWKTSLFGLLVCAGLLLGVWQFSRWRFGAGRFGFGDVMLGGLIGTVFGAVLGLWVIALGMLLAGGYAGVCLWRGASRQQVFGYGTFLALVAAFWLLV